MSKPLTLYKIELPAKIAADLLGVLSPDEQKFAQTIRTESVKNLHISVRSGVRQILAAHLNQACEKINLAKTAYGKPYLVDYPEVQFNISHSTNNLLVAISTIGAVGIDIEQANPQRRDFSGLVEKCFAKSEQNYWHNLPETEKAAEFYRFWTRKEAFVKAVGRGLAMGLQECVIVSGISPSFAAIPEVYGQPSDWRLFDLSLKAGLYGAVVLRSDKISTGFALPEIMSFDNVKI